MLSQLGIVVATAMLSSLLTLGIGYLVLQGYMRRQFEAGLRETIRRINAEVGPEIEARVKKGVKEGVKSLPTREVLKETTWNMARTGAELVNEGIKPFLKKKRTRSESDMLNKDDLDDFL